MDGKCLVNYLLGFGSTINQQLNKQLLLFLMLLVLPETGALLFLCVIRILLTEVEVLILESRILVGGGVLSKKRRRFDFISRTWWNLSG